MMDEKDRDIKLDKIYRNSSRYCETYFQIEKLNSKLNKQEDTINKLVFDLSRTLGIVQDIAEKLETQTIYKEKNGEEHNDN